MARDVAFAVGFQIYELVDGHELDDKQDDEDEGQLRDDWFVWWRYRASHGMIGPSGITGLLTMFVLHEVDQETATRR